MALTLTVGRNSFKICHKSGSRTTVWDVSAESGEEALLQTFKDVISFVEGEQKPRITAWSAPVQGPEISGGTASDPPGNGWAAYKAPGVPDRLKDEVELIKPEEDG